MFIIVVVVGFNKKHLWLKIPLGILLLLILSAAYYVGRPDTFLPHKRAVLRVPYEMSDPPISLVPMGEKVYHPDSPLGHPGIDIQWSGPSARVIASADGKIIRIKQVFDKWDKWTIEVRTWPYVVRYTEMEDYNRELKVGKQIKAGDFLGHPANPKKHNEIGAYQIHWEFASLSIIRDRFCPMTYFDDESRKSIQEVWDKTNWQYKNQYPDICSGDYANRID